MQLHGEAEIWLGINSRLPCDSDLEAAAMKFS